jgi:PleD family two-component response regulator
MNATNLAIATPDNSSEPKTRILVVDDVADNRDILVRRLARRGFEAVEASGGQQALELIAQQSFDVVLLDIMMPDMNGNDVLREVRRTHSDVELPVIMVSAKTQSEDVVESLSMGANDYVTKPIDFNVALARIANQVARKRASDAERVQANGLRAAVKAEGDQRRHQEEQLQYLAYHDPLTGLLNRSAFRDLVNQALD